MKNILKSKKFKIICLSCILLFLLLIIPILNGRSVINIIQEKVSYLALSEERQQLYDKMKIEYLNIKSRVTGTAPFNDGEISDENGVDVTDKDDYVRTFDLMKYTLELGIGPNTSHSGVTDSSVYEGGVIKVKAKLPNQGSQTLMTWEQDAWMQNVTYSNDKTEIYAEYHVPKGVSITNANQNLTFTVKVGGYKKQVTEAMAPEFEVWMEGNNPDDATSLASSLNAKDNRTTIISGKPSFNAKISQDGWLNSTYFKNINGNEVKGKYQNMGIGLALAQPNNNFSDLRGVEYPTGKISIKMKLEYRYLERNTTTWNTMTATTPNSLGILNGTEVVQFGYNGFNSPAYFPTSNACQATALPYGKKSSDITRSVVNSGDIDVSLDNDILTLSFENYIPTGPYPNKAIGTLTTLESNYGYFASANVEFFIPFFDYEDHEYNYQLRNTITEIDYYDSNGNNGVIDSEGATSVKDTKSNDNVASHAFYSYLPGGAWTRAEAVVLNAANSLGETYNLSQPYNAGNGSIMIGEDYLMRMYSRVMYGPFNGGMINMLSWNPSLVSIKKLDNNSWIRVGGSSPSGDPIPPTDQIKLYFGILKSKPSIGLENDTEINNASFTDFDWYDDFDEASSHGVVTSLKVDDPQYTGYNIMRWYFVRFTANNDSNNIGKVANYRYKLRYYADEERTKEYKYYEDYVFQGATYNDKGEIINTKSHTDLGESIKILGVLSSVKVTTTDTDSSGKIKSAYDVQDGEMNIKVTPELSNKSTASSNDRYLDNILVTTTLPNGLSYKNGSANKEPKNVVVNADGSTTLEWEYDNWQVNHNAPEYPNITFTADISASLENNASLKIKSTIFTEEDLRDEEQFRTSEYGVVISNLAGSKALKEIDKKVVEKNEKFNITSTLGNNSEEILRNVKTIEILPRDNDENSSKFDGTYTTKITKKIEGQKLFYTNKKISVIGLTEDKYGKLTIKDVDLENDSRWIEVNVGDTIPSDATAIATLIPEIPSQTEVSFDMEISPSNNKEANKYAFTLNMTSDNLQAAIKTNTVIATVVSRNIRGKAFIDKNRNNNYDTTDELLKNNVVKLLDQSGNIIRTTQTDNNGKYEFLSVEKGSYYVEFNIPTNYETIDKSASSKANSNGKTDIINNLNVVPTTPLLEVNDIDMGIRKISAIIKVRYEEYGNNTNLFDSTTIDKYYGDSYNLDNDYTPNIPDNYEFKSKTNNYTGTVNQKEINITYYYQKKDSKLTNSITKEGTTEIINKDDEVEYHITYKTKITDYLGNAKITIIDKLPLEIDEDSISSDGGVYDKNTKTIKWEINKEIKSITEPEIVIEKTIKFKYLNINPKEREIINSVEGITKLDNNERSVENTYKTDLKIPGTIIVKYLEVDENNKVIGSLHRQIEKTDLVGESYTSSALKFEGYELIEKPENEDVEFIEEEQILIYKYKKIELEVETVVHGIGGEITGDELVYYGDNSTKDKIVITALPDYVIEKIIINGEEIDNVKGKEKYIVDNFKDMTENKLVEVSFMKKPKIENPKTGLILSSILIVIAITLVLIKTIFLNKKKVIN